MTNIIIVLDLGMSSDMVGPQPQGPRVNALRELGYVYGEHVVTEPRGVINHKTAKALRLTIPHSLLLRADQVIE